MKGLRGRFVSIAGTLQSDMSFSIASNSAITSSDSLSNPGVADSPAKFSLFETPAVVETPEFKTSVLETSVLDTSVETPASWISKAFIVSAKLMPVPRIVRASGSCSASSQSGSKHVTQSGGVPEDIRVLVIRCCFESFELQNFIQQP